MQLLRHRLLLAALACTATLLSTQAMAQGFGPVKLAFVTPEPVDPNKVVTFTAVQTAAIAGADLVVSQDLFPNVKGTEVHSAIPGTLPNSIRDITSIQISFTYAGDVNVLSMGSQLPGGPNYAPWAFTGGKLPNTDNYVFTFTQSPTAGSAPINDNFVPGPGYPHNQSFGTFTVFGADADARAFADQNPAGSVFLTPGTTGGQDRPAAPEPSGALVCFGGTGAVFGAVLMRRRRRSTRSAS